MSDQLVSDFISLFRGRGDIYAEWRGDQILVVRQPLTRLQFERHLSDGPYLGVYPVINDLCSWGCIDIDFDDRQLARNIVGALAYKDIQGWIEQTRRGYHIWVLPDVPLVPAADMRRCLMAACKAVGYDPKEVNPKQEVATGGKVGNWVRLPYPGGVNATERWLIIDERIPSTATGDRLFPWLDQHGRSSAQAIKDVAALWTPPPTPSLEIGTNAELSKDLTDKMSGLSYKIWKEGPLEGSDRSSTMFRLAALLKDDGLTPSEAFTVLSGAAWNKYLDRPNHDELVIDLIEKAYR